jgi:hypothetical protein
MEEDGFTLITSKHRHAIKSSRLSHKARQALATAKTMSYQQAPRETEIEKMAQYALACILDSKYLHTFVPYFNSRIQVVM